jgi:hypothetical protein
MVAKLDRMVREAGGRYAEAPMTRTHADIGKVNVLFGGEAELLDDLRPYFQLYAENIFPSARSATPSASNSSTTILHSPMWRRGARGLRWRQKTASISPSSSASSPQPAAKAACSISTVRPPSTAISPR